MHDVAGDLGAGLQKGDRRVVVDRLGVHRTDNAKFIHNRCRAREEFTHPRPALPMPAELEDRAGQWQGRLVPGHAGQALAHTHRLG